MNIRELTILIRLERVLGIYRNFWDYDRKTQIVIAARVVVDLGFFFTSFFCSIILAHKLGAFDVVKLYYKILYIVTSVALSLLPLRYSDVFNELTKNLCTLHEFYKNFSIYNRTDIHGIIFGIVTGLLLTLSLITLAEMIIDTQVMESLKSFLNMVFTKAYVIVFEVKIYLELYVYVSLLLRVKSFIDCLDSVIRDVISDIHRHNWSGRLIANESLIEACFYQDAVEVWALHCRILVTCSKLINWCFGELILSFILSGVVHFIITTSHLIEDFVKPKKDHESEPSMDRTIAHLGAYFTIIVLLIYFGQIVNNAWNDLKKSLARLHFTIVLHTVKKNQEVHDLLRLVTLEPVEARLLSTMPLRMSLVPAILSITVSYMIVMLQFNNVV